MGGYNNLLHAIAYIHSKNIIHRDIKPSNFLYNVKERCGKLIDFGVAKISVVSTGFQHAIPTARKKAMLKVCSHNPSSVCDICLSRKVKNVPRAGTPGYRAPEILLGSKKQTNAIDIWSVGVILLSLMSGYYPVFRFKTDLHSIEELISIFGTTCLVQVADTLNSDLTVSESFPGIGLETLCHNRSKLQEGDLSEMLLILLKSLLTVDPTIRINACGALSGALFNNL